MKILVLGGTRFFGVPMVKALLEAGHEVTIASRGNTNDDFGDKVKRIVFERTSAEIVKAALGGVHYDVVIDKLAYCSNDIKYVMDVVDCEKYIHTSSTAVYEPKHMDTREEEFDAATKGLVWCNRADFPYDEIKRQAECALWQNYGDKNWTAVRFPFVIGEDDYTKRLLFYVEHTMKSVPMYIDNLECQMGFVSSEEAGKFMAFLAEQEFQGAINGSAYGTISPKEIIEYVEKKTSCKAVLAVNGDVAPYNGEPEYSINVGKAEALGFQFSNLRDWIFELLDYYIEQVKQVKAIIVDLDRTLLHTDKSISEYTLSVLKKCHEKGILLMAATARPERSILTYHEQIHFDAMTVMNGADVVLPGQKSLNYAVLRDSAEEILKRLCELPDIILSVELGNDVYANVEIPEWEAKVFHDFPKLPTEGPVYKILVSRENENIGPLVETLLTEDTYCTVAGNNLVQVMSRQATKWNGIKAMLDAFGVSRSEAVYFGDDNDDIEPLKNCGIGVAVENAIEAAKEVADVVTESNDEDGVAKWIERNIMVYTCSTYK